MNKNNFITLEMIKVSQLQSGSVFTGKMTFGQLKEVYKLTERMESSYDPLDMNINGTQTSFFPDETEFQRHLNPNKLSQIKNYLKEELKKEGNNKKIGIFPTSLILYNKEFDLLDFDITGESEYPSESQIFDSYTEDLNCCFYRPVDGSSQDIFKLYVPKNKGITLIVDGQHRFFGTMSLYNTLDSENKKIIDGFEFIITFLVGFDLHEVGQIFADVNFKQKPVNRSLYYDIFGASPQLDNNGTLHNRIRLLHDLTLHLNNNDHSPIKGMIKLLGRGSGLFSQAFFVDAMINNVLNKGIWKNFINSYLMGNDEYKIIAEFMKAYLNSLKKAYSSSWPTLSESNVYSVRAYEYILCKTTGLGAYIRLIPDIYPLIEGDPKDFEKKITEIFSKISDDEAKIIFSKSGNYGGAGSEGLQGKLYKELKVKYGL